MSLRTVVLVLSLLCVVAGIVLLAVDLQPKLKSVPSNGETTLASLSYSGGTLNLVGGEAMTPVMPVIASDVQYVSYTVTPALPSGLVLDPYTGQISGTPDGGASSGTYTITGTHPAGYDPAAILVLHASDDENDVKTHLQKVATTYTNSTFLALNTPSPLAGSLSSYYRTGSTEEHQPKITSISGIYNQTSSYECWMRGTNPLVTISSSLIVFTQTATTISLVRPTATANGDQFFTRTEWGGNVHDGYNTALRFEYPSSGDAWRHYGIVVQQSTVDPTVYVRFYLDGVLVGWSSGPRNNARANSIGMTHLRINLAGTSGSAFCDDIVAYTHRDMSPLWPRQKRIRPLSAPVSVETFVEINVT